MTIKSAELTVRFKASQQGANDIATPSFAPVLEQILQFTGGITANKADLLFIDERVTSGNDDIDLYGVLADAFGATLNVAEVVGIIVKVNAASTGNALIGGGTNPWTGLFGTSGDIVKVCPGGIFVNFAPDANGLGAVTAATADILRVAASAGSITYQIAILGRSA